MTDPIPAGTWVEIHRVLLAPEDRAPQIPQDTRRVPLEMRVKGFLRAPARVGEQARIETRTGRPLQGTLVAVNPPYAHGFGPPVPELTVIGGEVREILRTRRGRR